jgi:DmsE family decaheme c-type cytochrome
MTRLALVILLLAVACTRQAADDPATPPPAATYVGQETCEGCHDDAATSFKKTIHAHVLADESRPEAERGCEACHGPGSVHFEEGGGAGVGGLHEFTSEESASARSRVCLRCHGQSRLHDFLSGGHALSQVACTDCHRLHGGTPQKMLREPPASLCTSCHQDIRLRFGLPEHHKVPEGAMTCLDCHEPHGSRTRALLKEDEDRLCTTCHAEVQGPFVFEHVGLVSEGCTGCHEPHGSTNRHLLTFQQVAQVCLECHTATPSNHTQPTFRDCTRCHTAIHGSNTDPHFMAP